MIIDDLKRVIDQNKRSGSKAYLLNVLKETLQTYILYFIYTSDDFKEMIFTGGTCLRRVYGLNRLSVDLDFDFESASSPKETLAEKLEAWFVKEHQMKDLDVAVRKDTIKIKLQRGLDIFPETGREAIFVSVDISPVNYKEYGTENNLISTPEFSFIVKNFDLPTMFANKICAFLGRDFKFGGSQNISFKARDVYDLFWLCQRSKQGGYQLRPKFKRLFEDLKVTDRQEVVRRVLDKIKVVDDNQVKIQLLPFFPDARFVETFAATYKNTLVNDIERVFA